MKGGEVSKLYRQLWLLVADIICQFEDNFLTKKGGFKMRNQRLTILSVIIFCAFFLSLFTTASAESGKKPMEIKVADWNPENRATSRLKVDWARKIEERSDGKVKFTFFFSGSLGGFRESYRTMLEGVADICFWAHGVIPKIHALNEVVTLPFMGWDRPMLTRICHDLPEKFPEFDKEYEGAKNLYIDAHTAYVFSMREKGVRVPDDLRNMKILAPANGRRLVDAIGGVPLHKGPRDYYMSLAKGLADGMLNDFLAVDIFKCMEAVTSHTRAGEGGFGRVVTGYWMNKNTWNKLPPVTRRAIMDLKPWIEQEFIELFDKMDKEAENKARKMGDKVIDLTPEEVEIWKKVAQPVHEQWIQEMEAQGKPGKAVYEEIKRLISMYKKM